MAARYVHTPASFAPPAKWRASTGRSRLNAARTISMNAIASRSRTASAIQLSSSASLSGSIAASVSTDARPKGARSRNSRTSGLMDCIRIGRLRYRQLSGNALEELIDDHTGSSAHHTLSDAGDRTAGRDISGIVKQRARVVWNQLNRSFALNESGRATAIHCHLVFRGGPKIMKTDRSTEDAADRPNTEPQLHLIGIIARLDQLFATREAFGNPIRVCEKTPYGQGCRSIKCELPLDFHGCCR